jgi:RNA-directed DNA polymerase
MTIQAQKIKPLPLGHAPLKSLRNLEYRLGIKREILLSLAKGFSDSYTPFLQAKVPKPHARIIKPIKFRDIDNPSNALKMVQDRILDRLLAPVTLPHFLFGAVRNRCIRAHAREHLGAKVIVKMDIRSYYPNITNRQVFHVWRNVLLCSPRLARLLTKLTTYDGHLPQGAPTSPALANILLASIYSPILQACADKKIVATAWVDDLIFSGDEARAVMELVRSTLAANALRLSTRKTCILNARKAKIITGARLGKDGLRACKIKIRDIRAGIHNLKCGRVTSLGWAKDVEKLRGQIAFVRSLCPSDATRLAESLDHLEHQVETDAKATPRCPFTMDIPFPPMKPGAPGLDFEAWDSSLKSFPVNEATQERGFSTESLTVLS